MGSSLRSGFAGLGQTHSPFWASVSLLVGLLRGLNEITHQRAERSAGNMADAQELSPSLLLVIVLPVDWEGAVRVPALGGDRRILAIPGGAILEHVVHLVSEC